MMSPEHDPEAWEIAEYFGIPEEMVRVQGRLSQ